MTVKLPRRRIFPSAHEDAQIAGKPVEATHCQSARYRLAFQDPEFLLRDELRPVRLQLELLKPELILQEHHIESTIVIFGSARIPEPQAAGNGLEAAKAELQHDAGNPVLQRKVRIAERRLANSHYYEEARKLGRLIGEHSDDHRLVVMTGGGPGVMEAANRGAQEAGGRSIGLNIGLPHEQRPNPFITPGLSFEFRYFFMRKLWFAYVARAIVVFPGGFGTLDELFEFLTLSQTGKIDPPPATLLYGTRYWNEIVDFDALARHGMVDAADLRLLHFVDTPAEAMAVLRKRLRPHDEAEPPAIARSITPEDACATCGPEKEEHR
jgi:hypothetical protein